MNLLTKNNTILVISGTSKDHKVENEPKTSPHFRPIMGASFGEKAGLTQIGQYIFGIVFGFSNNLVNFSG